ncbi:hypothetical protein HPP92_002488 [Vanilla planifolia]|uniref:CBF1-interacting co-repressor CIR N-terminal domain-containing protein n=1 Tax=Vanilla planifolia TaxID=51239 RepID=A0A835VGC0_VANPL|nr:hypothetical protein HPP92_002488 [Vanilla planifolia]
MKARPKGGKPVRGFFDELESRRKNRPWMTGIQAAVADSDYKTKVGTAWSHSYLNQKPWHPLSYPNQRRKWIAEQSHANRERRSEEVAREFAQEQEFFRQTALFSKKEKEKMEMMKAVSFMYVRPPGYNAESAKAAEDADVKKRLDENSSAQDLTTGTSCSSMQDSKPEKGKPVEEKKSRPKDVFGRPLPTENEFEVLKNAPRLETGMPARVKPFGVEIRNVRCVRCGAFGHQSGDRECPLKDVIMPNEESRLKRDDPLTAIMAQTSSAEPVKWELKQKPGMSPPRGGFQPDDPNQQIVAEEIFDEYGGFLSGGDIPALLSSFKTKSNKHSTHKSKHRRKSSVSHAKSKLEDEASSSDTDHAKKHKWARNKSDATIIQKKMIKNKHDGHWPKADGCNGRSRIKHDIYSSNSDDVKGKRRSKRKHDIYSSESEVYRRRPKQREHKLSDSSSDFGGDWQSKRPFDKHGKCADAVPGRRSDRSRNEHKIPPDSKFDRPKRSIAKPKKFRRHHSVSSNSESLDSDSIDRENSRGRRKLKHRRHDGTCEED